MSHYWKRAMPSLIKYLLISRRKKSSDPHYIPHPIYHYALGLTNLSFLRRSCRFVAAGMRAGGAHGVVVIGVAVTGPMPISLSEPCHGVMDGSNGFRGKNVI